METYYAKIARDASAKGPKIERVFFSVQNRQGDFSGSSFFQVQSDIDSHTRNEGDQTEAKNTEITKTVELKKSSIRDSEDLRHHTWHCKL